MNIDWGTETVADVTARLGRPPADLVSFVAFPFAAADETNLDAAAAQARDAGAVLVVTLEPWGGLASITDASLAELTARLARYGRDGVPAIVRFAHEMNGSWYPWGQDPSGYIAAFRRVADAVHAGAPTAALLWAPNQGDGYPYRGGKYAAKARSAAAKVLDTNHDGRVDATDDPYAPYWPGADYVDWVGMSLYHWGTAYPWGENEIPGDGKFDGLVTGATTTGIPVPDFYKTYAERYDKPLAIVETAALYRPGAHGATEASIKQAWLAQVLSPKTRARFPRLRLVNWFEWRKNEAEVGSVVDWRISVDPKLRASFLAAVDNGFDLGPVVARAQGCGPA
jgi:glycosyl hydrolase family 26